MVQEAAEDAGLIERVVVGAMDQVVVLVTEPWKQLCEPLLSPRSVRFDAAAARFIEAE